MLPNCWPMALRNWHTEVHKLEFTLLTVGDGFPVPREAKRLPYNIYFVYTKINNHLLQQKGCPKTALFVIICRGLLLLPQYAPR